MANSSKYNSPEKVRRAKKSQLPKSPASVAAWSDAAPVDYVPPSVASVTFTVDEVVIGESDFSLRQTNKAVSPLVLAPRKQRVPRRRTRRWKASRVGDVCPGVGTCDYSRGAALPRRQTLHNLAQRRLPLLNVGDKARQFCMFLRHHQSIPPPRGRAERQATLC